MFKNIVKGIILISIISVIQFTPHIVLANSCQCYKAIGNEGSKSTFGECHTDISLEECGPSKFNYPYEEIKVISAQGAELKYVYSCTSFRDNNCKEAVGTQDPNSKFNACWLQTTCESSGGTWDAEHKNKPPCSKFGTQDTARCFINTPDISLQIAIPGLNDRDDQGKPVIRGGFPAYIAAFYKFFVAALAVIAIVMVMWGGFKRIMAAGSPERVKDANDTIMGAITGVVIALLSYSLLSLVNPNLVKNFGINIEKIKPETFGDWCPEPDPTDPNKHYQCGDQATVDGRTCIGSMCPSGTGGCYKIGKTGEKDSNGKLRDYECLEKWQACEKITADNIEELHGISAQDFLTTSGDSADIVALNNICQAYDPNCYWVHTVINSDGCQYYSQTAKTAACQGNSTCDDFNTYTPWENLIVRTVTGSDFAACTYNFCPSLSCKIKSEEKLGLRALTLTDFITRSWGCWNK